MARKVHFFQGSPSRYADFKFYWNTDMASLIGLTAAEVGFLVVKPFKKHPFLASSTNGRQTGNAPVGDLAGLSFGVLIIEKNIKIMLVLV